VGVLEICNLVRAGAGTIPGIPTLHRDRVAQGMCTQKANRCAKDCMAFRAAVPLCTQLAGRITGCPWPLACKDSSTRSAVHSCRQPQLPQPLGKGGQCREQAPYPSAAITYHMIRGPQQASARATASLLASGYLWLLPTHSGACATDDAGSSSIRRQSQTPNHAFGIGGRRCRRIKLPAAGD
jgi:hypothetical protein